jgi:hypothetical protein
MQPLLNPFDVHLPGVDRGKLVQLHKQTDNVKPRGHHPDEPRDVPLEDRPKVQVLLR